MFAVVLLFHLTMFGLVSPQHFPILDQPILLGHNQPLQLYSMTSKQSNHVCVSITGLAHVRLTLPGDHLWDPLFCLLYVATFLGL